MQALGLYDEENTSAGHVREAARLGGVDAYRVRMLNVLPGTHPVIFNRSPGNVRPSRRGYSAVPPA